MTEDRRRRPSAWMAGAAALIGGFLVYIALAGSGGGVDWEDRLTFDQSGELELEALGIFLGLVVGAAVGAPLGAYVALRWARAPGAGKTALVTAMATVAATALAVWAVPSASDDPVLLPYAVFGAWFLTAFLTRWAIAQ